MKKITLLAIAFVAISSASCKKDRTCSCTTKTTTVTTGFGAGTSSSSQTYDVTIQKASKGTAKVNCISTKSTEVNTYGSGSFKYTDTDTNETTCTLK
jgi:hypothetical protein